MSIYIFERILKKNIYISVFNTMKMLLLFWGKKQRTWPPPIQLLYWPAGYQAMLGTKSVAGQGVRLGSVWWDIRALPPMAGEKYCITSSASLSFMCSQDFISKEEEEKATLYFESAIPPKNQDLFLYYLL